MCKCSSSGRTQQDWIELKIRHQQKSIIPLYHVQMDMTHVGTFLVLNKRKGIKTVAGADRGQRLRTSCIKRLSSLSFPSWAVAVSALQTGDVRFQVFPRAGSSGTDTVKACAGVIRSCKACNPSLQGHHCLLAIEKAQQVATSGCKGKAALLSPM